LKNEAIKLLLPEDLKTIQTNIAEGSVTVGGIFSVPYQTIMDVYVATQDNIDSDPFEELVTSMNRGAEKAASKALPIFASALTNMSISDGLSILQGDNTSATRYFKNATKASLQIAFRTDINDALDQTNANKLYNGVYEFMNYEYKQDFLFETYTISPKTYMNIDLPPSIADYATDKAIDGLFHLVGEEEKKIRANPLDYASSIIQKVFNSSEAKG